MTEVLAYAVVWLNTAANAVGRVLLAPVAVLPGWLSATLISVATGVLLLWIFKYTSNQRAIRRARNDINSSLLASKLFKESARVAVRAQGSVLWGAARLLVLSLVPMLVMALPVCLLLGQLSLWYQARPLRVGEQAVVTVKVNDVGENFPEVALEPSDAVAVAIGPVRVLSRGEVCWQLEARESGYHRLVFRIDGRPVEKELAIGDGFLRVSARRPAWDWSDALLHPWETPLRTEAPAHWISIEYPTRSSWTSGTDSWLIYWFAMSMVGGLLFRPLLNVNL